MNRNWNWQGWVAIALAGLALMVALGGRGPWSSSRWAMGWSDAPQVQAVPAAPQAPPPFDRGFGRGHDGPQVMPGRGEFHREFRGGPIGPMGRHGHHGLFGFFGLIGGLTKLIALGLLAWLLLRMFNQSRNSPPAAPTQTTPAGHDPTVE